MISVLVVDDQPAVRNGFAAPIDAQDHMHPAGEAANGREAVALTRPRHPPVLPVDARQPGPAAGSPPSPGAQ